MRNNHIFIYKIGGFKLFDRLIHKWTKVISLTQNCTKFNMIEVILKDRIMYIFMKNILIFALNKYIIKIKGHILIQLQKIPQK